MALEHERRLQSPSPPASSGRDSPLSRLRAPRRQLEDELTKNDKPYRRWAIQVERALTPFDAARLEWPDYISALGRLLKAIQSHPPSPDAIPHRSAVANKLAQSLDPSLPSGVHQKALELYDLIFSLIGKDAVARDLSVFLPGLSPVLSFASLSIRPVFLTILETHIAVLDANALRPALRALLLCLLPGLEEENGEDFDRTLKLIEIIRDAINTNPQKGDEYFWQCLFLSAISGSTRRQGVLAFLTRRLPKLGPVRSSVSQTVDGAAQSKEGDLFLPQAVVSPEPGLLIRCFAAGLEDSQPLLQRGFLDLLLSHLPLHSPVLVSRVGEQDLERLVLAATAVVARRDMSLNRRLWSWFLGPNHTDDDNDIMSPMATDRKENKGLHYFQRYGLKPLSNSILRMLNQGAASLTERVRPYRISLSLMDRWEIGGCLVPCIFIPALSHLKSLQQTALDTEYQEVLRSANGFFDGIDSGVIWAEMIKLIESSLSLQPTSNESRRDKLDLVCFTLNNFNVRDEEMIALHIPLSCAYTLASIVDREASEDFGLLTIDANTLEKAMSLAEQLVSIMPERAQLNASFGKEHDMPTVNNKHVVGLISLFYTENSGDPSSSPPPFSSHDVARFLLDNINKAFASSIEKKPLASVVLRAKILSLLISKTPNCHDLDMELLGKRCFDALQQQNSAPDKFVIAQSVTRIVANLLAKSSLSEQNIFKSTGVLPALFEIFWSFLSPSTPKFHVESVRSLWQLDSAIPADGILESSVSRFIAVSLDDEAEAARQFAVLWTHSINLAAGMQKRSSTARRSSLIGTNSVAIEARDHQNILTRPLLLGLEGLNAEGSELYFFLVSWLKSSGILFTVFDLLLEKLIALGQHQKRRGESGKETEEHQLRLLHSDKTSECCYHLKHIANLLRLPLDNINVVLAVPGNAQTTNEGEEDSLYETGVKVCLDVAEHGFTRDSASSEMQCLALSVLQQFFALSDQTDLELPVLQQKLLDMLARCTQQEKTASSVQVALLDTTMSYLKARFSNGTARRLSHHRKVSSIDGSNLSSIRPNSAERNDRKPSTDRSPPPEQLLKRLQEGITSPQSRSVLENWVGFLVEVLPLYAHSLFQNLIPVVETFCRQISSNFERIQEAFAISGGSSTVMSETSLMALLNGLEHTLAIAHDRLAFEENNTTNTKPVEASQGFLGNVVSGVFASEPLKGRASSANSKLTVTLCLQDAVRICFSIWSWAAYGHEDEHFDSMSSASFNYSSSRLRNRARRLLDRMFVAETSECLETLVALRDAATPSGDTRSKVISLLHTLDGSRPKRLMPAIFNSLYSRTNPSALEPNKMSSLTCDVKDTDLGVFLVDYSKSLDDDAMDEIWADCMTFLRDVLSNPLVHSSILPCLLLFLQTLAEKVEKTNFGEQRRMRKDLSDLFQRLLAATLTSRPVHDAGDGTGVIDILMTTMPKVHVIVQETDRQLSVVTSISRHIFEPLIHSKSFPENVTRSHLYLLQKVVRISAAAKVWRKDVAEIYNHQKLFSCKLDLVRGGLLPVLRQWGMSEKERVPDTLNRIPGPTTAGIMFGVGASAARLDADKKAQLNLRRAALLTLALDDDALVPSLSTLLEKVTELLNASSASSPSSASRAEVFMFVQAVVLKTASVHLTSLWPMVTAELQKAIASVMRDAKDYETYSALSLLQACRLLDLLLLVRPDDFQMNAWLFITDTIDAVYRPTDSTCAGLVDELAEELSGSGVAQSPGPGSLTPDLGALTSTSVAHEAGRRRLLAAKSGDVVNMGKEDLVKKVLRPWFTQLSLQCFEREYSMQGVDWEELNQGLLEELFTEGTMVA